MSATTIIFAVVSGALVAGVYSALVYGRRRRQGEEFNPYAFGGTVLVGAAWGGVLAFQGDTLTVDRTAEALTTYGGLVIFTESAIKFLASEYRAWRGR